MVHAHEARMERIISGLATRRNLAPAALNDFWQDRIDQVKSWLANGRYYEAEEIPAWLTSLEAPLAEFEQMTKI